LPTNGGKLLQQVNLFYFTERATVLSIMFF